MIERKVFKFRIEPNAEQEISFARHAGARRFVYNRALARRIETYKETGKSIAWSELEKELTTLKADPQFAWLKEIDSQSSQQAIADVKRAFVNFFEGRAGFPKFKKKSQAHQSFRIPQRVKLKDGKLSVPKIGLVKIRLSQNINLPFKSATFKRSPDGKWHVCLVVEFEIPEVPKPEPKNETAVGVDVGLRRFATDSEGKTTENPRFFRRAERKIKRAARRLSRRKGQANRAKARRALAREHQQIVNQRSDFAHKFSIGLIKEYETICCETLNLKGMSKTKRAKSVHDAAHRETFRQIEYKSRWYNRNSVFIDQWFPSSQLCSTCHHRNRDLQEKDESWRCINCGSFHDRDHNAGKNIKAEGLRILLAVGHTESLNAFGENVRQATACYSR